MTQASYLHMRSGVSHIYMRLLRGEVTSERYVAVVKRAVRMRLRPISGVRDR